jgi:class 3 adenylate cyclase/tetratricopeptide (TPR) repeat protein
MADDSVAIEAAVAALDAQRGMLGDAVVDVAIRALLERVGPDGGSANQPRLRQATVLFVDVVGSTAIGSALDPEDVYAVMERIASNFTGVVARWFGQVVKYTGDGLLAVFGVDSGQEQAAEHAIRAGLDMLAELPGIRSVFADRLAGRVLDVRVGVDTGLVLIGGGVEGTSSIRGAAVNLAARMEQHAPAGGLRISHDTYRHVRGLFDVVSEPPIAVKGVDEPLQTYLVRAVRPRAFRAPTRGIDGVETPMVGRATELALLQRAFGAATAGEARWHLVVADAGLGKSRLLHEFRNWVEAGGTPFRLLVGRAQLASRAEPFGLLRDLFTGWIRGPMLGDEPMSVGAFRRAVEPLVGEASARLLEHAFGLEVSDPSPLAALSTTSEDLRHRIVRAVSRLIGELAVHETPGAPVVLLFEDLHWADDGTLEALEHVARVNPDIALLAIATTRPELLDRRPRLAAPLRGRAVRIDLGPLDEAHADDLVRALLSNLDVVPPDLHRRIVMAGDGVPFFLEEAVRMLLDEGAIHADGNGWHLVDDRLARSPVPDTLAGVLQARLDALSRDELAAAQRASVIGHLFWSEGVAALGGRPGAIDGLVARGLVVAQPHSSLPAQHEFAFRHHLLHQFVYDSLLKADRRSHHAAAATWLAATTTGSLDHLAVIAEHHERAGSAGEAVSWFVRASEEAAGRSAGRIADDLTGRALALIDETDASTRWKLVSIRERVLAIGDDRHRHDADLADLASLADVLDRDELRAEAACRLAEALVDRGDYADALVAGDRAISWLGTAGDPELLARAELQLGSAYWRLGDHALAKRYCEQAMHGSLAAGRTATTVDAAIALSTIVAALGDPLKAEALVDDALELARQLGNRLSEAGALQAKGVHANGRGSLVEALSFYAETVAVARDIGWMYGESVGALNEAMTLFDLGRFEESIARARAAADTASLTGSRDLEAAAEGTVGYAALSLERAATARVGFERSLELFRLNGSEHYTLMPTVGLAVLDLAAGDLTAALNGAGQVADHLDRGGTLAGVDFPLLTSVHAYRILAAAGDDRAAHVLAEGKRLVDVDLGPRPGAADDTGPWDRRLVAEAWDELHHFPQS